MSERAKTISKRAAALATAMNGNVRGKPPYASENNFRLIGKQRGGKKKRERVKDFVPPVEPLPLNTTHASANFSL